MKKVRELLTEYEYKDLYSKYGLVNILCDIYSNLKPGAPLSNILSDVDFMNYDLSFDDLCYVVNLYKNKMYYIETIKNGLVTHFDFSPLLKTNGKNKGGHVVSSYKYFGDYNQKKNEMTGTYKRIEDFLISKGNKGTLNQCISPSNTKNVNPFVKEYQTHDMYMVASNIVTTITTKKFNKMSFNDNIFTGIIPDLSLETLFDYFEHVIYNYNSNTFLVDRGVRSKEKIIRPDHHYQNFNDTIKWYIKDVDTSDIIQFNLIIFISSIISDIQNISDRYKKFKESIIKCKWYQYSVADVKTFSIDYDMNKIIFDNYRNVNDYFNDFKVVSDKKKQSTYKALISFMKNPNYRSMNNILSLEVKFKENNKIVNEYVKKLKINHMIDDIKELSKNINDKMFFIYKDRYDNIAPFYRRSEKIDKLKSEIVRNVNNTTNIIDIFEYLVKLSQKHKQNFINISIEKYISMSNEEFIKFKQLLNIMIYTKFETSIKVIEAIEEVAVIDTTEEIETFEEI